ncbi:MULTISPECIES: sensor histidine kinase [unclassified Empedobacter]|uniref:sensor histidine kinase n=1 Tax=unclassified Empedobacter TaxID=2643773 RepID=UPI002576257F|nr:MULTISPECIES: histidine kinase [unclassified Empedobacter]
MLLQQDHLENQLKLLQDHVNPHVMFNILNHIHILLKKDTELASFLLLKFSDILRYQLYECNKNEVVLENEIQYLKDLIDVEKLRWGNEIDVSTSFTIMNKKAMIAPLLLVPFIENAFKHVSRVPDYKGFIKINFNENNNQIHLSIENTYAKIPIQSKSVGGIGLQNVKKRLNLIYPEAYQLNITENGQLYKVYLTINLSST